MAAIAAGSASSRSTAPVTVVATNLNNPRNLAAMPDGSVYIAEAGKAGPKCVTKDTCLGFSSSITRWSPGKRQRVVRNLLSAGGKDGTVTTGADGVSVDRAGRIYVAMTGPPECKTPPSLPAPARAQLSRLLRVTNGKVEAVADLNGLECKNNCDRADRNSNRTPCLRSAATMRSSSMRARTRSSTFAARRRRCSPCSRRRAALSPCRRASRSAPTAPTTSASSRARARAGRRPASPGYGKSFPDGSRSSTDAGFSAITGVAVAKDGTLYVTEFTVNPANQQEARGAVIKVTPDGKRTRLGVGQLFFPAGAALGPDGSLYVSNWSILPGTPAKGGPFKGKTGQLVRIKP